MKLDKDIIRRIVRPPSERDVDYAHLRDLLLFSRLQEADQETYRILHRLIRKQTDAEGFVMSSSDIARIPCRDLQTINWLWEVCVNDHLGFAVQRRIWESLCPPSRGYPTTYDDLCCFGDQVGWRSQGKWLDYKQLTFNASAPEGHLPAILFWVPRNLWFFEGEVGGFFDLALADQGAATSSFPREIFQDYVRRVDAFSRRLADSGIL
jgi:hypothetical protein